MTMVLITLVADQFPIDLMTIAQCTHQVHLYRFNTVLLKREKRDSEPFIHGFGGTENKLVLPICIYC